MNILLVADPFASLRKPYATDIAAVIVDLANGLVQLGHSVDVIALDTDEHNQFSVIHFDESIYAMKDNAYRPCPEWLGQQYYQSLQFGLLDVTAYDIIHYISATPELFEMGALHNIPAVISLYSEPSVAHSTLYGVFTRRTSAVLVAASKQLQESWQQALTGFTTADIQIVADDAAAAYGDIYQQMIAAAKVEQA